MKCHLERLACLFVIEFLLIAELIGQSSLVTIVTAIAYETQMSCIYKDEYNLFHGVSA